MYHSLSLWVLSAGLVNFAREDADWLAGLVRSMASCQTQCALAFLFVCILATHTALQWR